MTIEPNEQHPARPSHLPTLDGLRAVAVLLVMWSHVPQNPEWYPQWLQTLRHATSPGEYGVEIFFVLSGFLITRILLVERRQGRPVWRFMVRRILRIFPIYYLLIASIALVRPTEDLLWCALYLANFWFVAGGDTLLLGHTWSLCIEEHFYLVWPVVVALGSRRFAQRAMTFAIMPGAVVGAAVVTACMPLLPASDLVRAGSPFRFFSLGAGCLLAFHEAALMARPRRAALLGAVLVVFGLAATPFLWVFAAPKLLGFGLPITWGLPLWLVQSGSLCAGIVLCTLAGSFRGSRWVRPLASSLMRGIGRISYGLYLYHLPIFVLLMGPAPTIARVLAVLAATFALATASYWIVERPLLRLGARFR